MATDPDHEEFIEEDEHDELARRSIFSAGWFRALLVLTVLAIIVVVSLPYLLNWLEPTPAPPGKPQAKVSEPAVPQPTPPAPSPSDAKPPAPAVSPSPQHLSRGNVALSISATRAPAFARVIAAALPAGPAPTTATSTSVGNTATC